MFLNTKRKRELEERGHPDLDYRNVDSASYLGEEEEEEEECGCVECGSRRALL